MIDIRRVRAPEWVWLRRTRLRALDDAPEAFATTLAVEARHPESHWRELATQSELGQTAALFVARDGERWVGMIGARWFDRDQGVVQLWGMWVDPAARRRGFGERLVDQVHRWAAGHRARCVRLGVIEGVAGAAAFYERLGFVATGETRPLVRDDKLTAVFFARPV